MQTAKLNESYRQSGAKRNMRCGESEPEIDLERVIYDPAYRSDVRDRLNRDKRDREQNRNS